MSERLGKPHRNHFPAPLSDRHMRVLPAGTLVGRIHATGGPYPTRWDDFRAFGPLGSRFDHQPPPRRVHPARAVLYGAAARLDASGNPVPVLRACVAEVFRDRGVIELSRDAPYYVLFRLARDVPLLDVVDSDWVTLADGNAAISSGPRRVARDWSRAIYATYPQIQGIFYGCSNIPSERSVCLYERANDAVPLRPALHMPLTHPALRAELENYAVQLRLDLFL